MLLSAEVHLLTLIRQGSLSGRGGGGLGEGPTGEALSARQLTEVRGSGRSGLAWILADEPFAHVAAAGLACRASSPMLHLLCGCA